MENKNTFQFERSFVLESEEKKKPKSFFEFVYFPEPSDEISVYDDYASASNAFLNSDRDSIPTELYGGSFPKSFVPEGSDERNYSFIGCKNGGIRKFYLYPETI